MISVQVDPQDQNRIVLTATVTLFLERTILQALGDELSEAIKRQAVRDLKRNPQVQKKISEAAQGKLLELLGIKPENAA